LSKRNWFALALIVVSFGLLYPGLTDDLITISVSFGGLQLMNETRSILGTVRSLHESGNDIVAGMIFFFGVMVPFIKAGILFIVLAMRQSRMRYRLFGFVKAISKWAMSDVFTVGVLVAFLSAKATEAMDAKIERGFYFFAAYCVLSILALQFMKLPPDPDSEAPSN